VSGVKKNPNESSLGFNVLPMLRDTWLLIGLKLNTASLFFK